VQKPKQAAEQEDVLLPEESELYREFELVLNSIADAATQKAEQLLQRTVEEMRAARQQIAQLQSDVQRTVEEMRAARQQIAQLQSDVQRLKLHVAVLTCVVIIGIGISLALQVWR
jgi:peptidoglycan hydrolase CwlO-like protein